MTKLRVLILFSWFYKYLYRLSYILIFKIHKFHLYYIDKVWLNQKEGATCDLHQISLTQWSFIFKLKFHSYFSVNIFATHHLIQMLHSHILFMLFSWAIFCVDCFGSRNKWARGMCCVVDETKTEVVL